MKEIIAKTNGEEDSYVPEEPQMAELLMAIDYFNHGYRNILKQRELVDDFEDVMRRLPPIIGQSNPILTDGPNKLIAWWKANLHRGVDAKGGGVSLYDFYGPHDSQMRIQYISLPVRNLRPINTQLIDFDRTDNFIYDNQNSTANGEPQEYRLTSFSVNTDGNVHADVSESQWSQEVDGYLETGISIITRKLEAGSEFITSITLSFSAIILGKLVDMSVPYTYDTKGNLVPILLNLKCGDVLTKRWEKFVSSLPSISNDDLSAILQSIIDGSSVLPKIVSEISPKLSDYVSSGLTVTYSNEGVRKIGYEALFTKGIGSDLATTGKLSATIVTKIGYQHASREFKLGEFDCEVVSADATSIRVAVHFVDNNLSATYSIEQQSGMTNAALLDAVMLAIARDKTFNLRNPYPKDYLQPTPED